MADSRNAVSSSSSDAAADAGKLTADASCTASVHAVADADLGAAGNSAAASAGDTAGTSAACACCIVSDDNTESAGAG
jgi:hypothetical protein